MARLTSGIMAETQNNRKRIGGIAGSLIGLIAAIILIPMIYKSFSFNADLKRAAAELNKSCPVQVDKDTRLDNAIILPDKVFQYNYTLFRVSKDSIDLEAFNNYMNPQIINSVRTNPDLKSFRGNRVTMVYNYRDMHGIFVTKITVTPDLYSEK